MNNFNNIGVQSIGIKMPIFKEGDKLESLITTGIAESVGFENGDVIGITESIVARVQGNYVTIDEIVKNIQSIFNRVEFDTIIVQHPIYSRNRFAMILKAIARATPKKVVIIMPNYDEVGNVLRNHPFTGMNYDEYYRQIVESEGKECEISQIPYSTVNSVIIDCKLHESVYKTTDRYITLKQLCNDKCWWGLLGSNKATEDKLKLFPNQTKAQQLVDSIQSNILKGFGKKVEVMVYGDGCFKAPEGIWEFADPVTTPAYTSGLKGSPNEIKLKAYADDQFKDLTGSELETAMKDVIKQKNQDLKGNMQSQGTTPRRYVDLLASLMDLTSGSGDKGTPVVVVRNYFKNYADE